jgi:O-antigen/teichoic acid export membrane protein
MGKLIFARRGSDQLLRLVSTILPTFRRKNLAASVGTGYLQTAVVSITNLILVPILLTGLGRHRYGIWLTLYSVGYWVYLVIAWFAPAMVQQMGANLARGRVLDTARTARAGEAVAAAAGAAVLASAVVASNASRIGFLGGQVDVEVRTSLILTGIWIALRVINSVWSNVLTAAARLPAVHSVQMGGVLAAGSISALGVGLGGDLRVVVGAYAVGELGVFVVLRVLGRRSIGAHAEGLTLDPLKPIAATSVPYIVGGIGVLLLNSDILLLAALTRPEQVARFGVALKVVEAFLQLIWRIPDSTQPHVVELDALSDKQALRRLHRSIVETSCVMGAGAATYLFIQGPRLLNAWVGLENSPSVSVIRLLSIYLFMQSFVHASVAIPYSTAKMQWVGRLLLGEGALKALLSILLIPFMGLAGTVSASLAAITIVTSWMVPRFTLRLLDDNLRDFASGSIPYVAISLVLTGIGAGIGWLLLPDSLAGVLGGAALSLVFFCGGAALTLRHLIRSNPSDPLR